MKKIIAIMLMLSMLIGGCGKADKATEAESTEAAGTEATVSTEQGTDSTDNTVEPTVELTEPSIEATDPSETPTEPAEPDENTAYHLHNLFSMTAEEIEASYGEMEYLYMKYGGAPVYRIDELKVDVVYFPTELCKPGELPNGLLPGFLIYRGNDKICCDLNIGMTGEEISNDIIWEDYYSVCGHDENFRLYEMLTKSDGYDMIVRFYIPDEIYDKYPVGSMTEDEEAEYKAWKNDFRYNLKNTYIYDIHINKPGQRY